MPKTYCSRDILLLVYRAIAGSLPDEWKNNFSSVELDLSRLSELPQKIRQLQQMFPEIDAVFSAGIGQFGSVEEFSYPQIEALMTINFTSQVFPTKALLPALKRKPNSDLIFIGSEAALKGSQRRRGLLCQQVCHTRIYPGTTRRV